MTTKKTSLDLEDPSKSSTRNRIKKKEKIVFKAPPPRVYDIMYSGLKKKKAMDTKREYFEHSARTAVQLLTRRIDWSRTTWALTNGCDNYRQRKCIICIICLQHTRLKWC